MDEIPNVEETPDDFIFNEDLSTTMGDNVCFCEGETVTVSILNGDYAVLELFKDGELVDSKSILGYESLTFKNFPFGDYAAYLVNGKERSSAIHFEIIETNVSLTEVGKELTINYSSTNGTPQYIIITDGNTFSPNKIIPLTPENKSAGKVTINALKDKTQVCKVFFEGQFGVIANKNKSIQQLLEQ